MIIDREKIIRGLIKEVYEMSLWLLVITLVTYWVLTTFQIVPYPSEFYTFYNLMFIFVFSFPFICAYIATRHSIRIEDIVRLTVKFAVKVLTAVLFIGLFFFYYYLSIQSAI